MSGQKKYPPSGVLFDNTNRKNDRSPDMTGNLVIDTELLKELVKLANNGEEIKMRLIAYKNSHPTRGEYLRITASKDEPYNGGKNGKTGNAPF